MKTVPPPDLNLYRVAFVGSRKSVTLLDSSTYVLAVSESGAMRAGYHFLAKSERADNEWLDTYYQCDTIRQSAQLQSEAQRVAYLVMSQ